MGGGQLYLYAICGREDSDFRLIERDGMVTRYGHISTGEVALVDSARESLYVEAIRRKLDDV